MLNTAAILLTLALLFLVTCLCLFEMSLTRVSKVTLRRLQERSKARPVEQLKALADNRLEGLVSVYVGIQVCMVTFAILVTGYLHSQYQSYAKSAGLLSTFKRFFKRDRQTKPAQLPQDLEIRRGQIVGRRCLTGYDGRAEVSVDNDATGILEDRSSNGPG